MKDELKVNVAEAVEYAQEIEKIGCNFRLKEYSNLEEKEKNSILFETLAKQFIRQCISNEMSEFNFKAHGTEITVSQKVKVELTVKNEEKTILVEVTYLKIIPVAFEGNELTYVLRLDFDECNETVKLLAEKRFPKETIQKIEISDSEREKMINGTEIEFWKKHLPKKLNFGDRDERFLADFCNVLNSHKEIEITGAQSVYMKRLYYVAVKLFPLFKGMTVTERVKILDNVFSGKRIKNDTIDKYYLSKKTFEEIAKIRCYRELSIGEVSYKMTREFYEKGSLKMIEYEYRIGKEKYILKTCFTPFDLWNMLVEEVGCNFRG